MSRELFQIGRGPNAFFYKEYLSEIVQKLKNTLIKNQLQAQKHYFNA